MAVEINGRYEGNLNVEMVHGPSGTVLRTAAPVDNQGDGSSYSPTDLVASALGACMMTLMGIVAQREGVDMTGATFRVEKHMQADPRRIGSLPIRFEMPAGLSPKQRKLLERAALTCPVHKSLHPEIRKDTEFIYPD